MSITRTTLAVALNATDQTCSVTSASGAPVNGLILIDNELALIKEISGTVLTLKRRGAEGTIAKAHALLTPVTFGLATDFPVQTGEGQPLSLVHAFRDVVSYGADGAIALPKRDTLVFLVKASALAMTLADPTNVPDGTFMTIISTVGAAHTVDLATGIVGSDSDDVFTFTTGIGATLQLVSFKGKWAHVSTSLTAAEAAAVAVA